jgi:hypothetical protein
VRILVTGGAGFLHVRLREGIARTIEWHAKALQEIRRAGAHRITAFEPMVLG